MSASLITLDGTEQYRTLYSILGHPRGSGVIPDLGHAELLLTSMHTSSSGTSASKGHIQVCSRS